MTEGIRARVIVIYAHCEELEQKLSGAEETLAHLNRLTHYYMLTAFMYYHSTFFSPQNVPIAVVANSVRLRLLPPVAQAVQPESNTHVLQSSQGARLR